MQRQMCTILCLYKVILIKMKNQNQNESMYFSVFSLRVSLCVWTLVCLVQMCRSRAAIGSSCVLASEHTVFNQINDTEMKKVKNTDWMTAGNHI